MQPTNTATAAKHNGSTSKLRRLARAAAVTAREAQRDGIVRTARRAVRTARLFGLSNVVGRAEAAAGDWSWYRLELGNLNRRELPAGMQLRRCREPDVPLFARLEPVAYRDAQRRFEAGGLLWMVLADEEPMFACWTFTAHSPVGQADHGWLQLPPRTAHLKDLITAESARGRGIAPGAISMIVDVLAADGLLTLFGRVEDSNFSSRRVYQKLGFTTMQPDDPAWVDFKRQGV